MEAFQVFHSLASNEPMYGYYGEERFRTETVYQGEQSSLPDTMINVLCNSSVMLGKVIWNMGVVYFNQKFYQRALRYFEVTKRMYDEAYGDNACHKDMTEALVTLGMACDALGQYEKADRYYQDGVLVLVQLFKPDAVSFLQEIDTSAGSRSDAHFYYEGVIETFLSLPGYKVAHSESAGIVQLFGVHLIHMKHHKLAEWLLGDIARNMYMQTDRYRPRDIEMAKNLSFLATNLWKQGKMQEASDLFLDALDMMDKLESNEYVDLETAELLQTMSLMFFEQRDIPRSRKYLKLSHDRYSKCCPETHPKLLETAQQLRRADSMY